MYPEERLIMRFTTYLFTFTLAILSKIVSASPTPIATPQCYDDSGQFPAPAALDCMRAMGYLQADLSYTTPQLFGVYADATCRVPKDWSYNSCLVSIDVDDASQMDTFSLASTVRPLASVEETCIVKKKLGQGFGGYVPIGNGKGFYATVQYDGDYWPTVPNSRFLLAANATSNETASPTS